MNELVQDRVVLDKDFSFSRVYQSLDLSAKLKSRAEDFIVEENIEIDFTGDGEHCWLYIKKRGCNTDWIAQQLARYCGIKKMAVSYAGLKDRNAVTSQWFSVQLPGIPTPDWGEFETSFSSDQLVEDVQVVKCFRHNKKLQRGALKSNTFKITLRELSDTSDSTFTSLEQRCVEIANGGVPNYFGSQRFGRQYNNLDQAIKLFAKPGFMRGAKKMARHKRGMYLSAARSWLFNLILSERIDRQIWDKRLPGDVFMLAGKSACFKDEENNIEQLSERLKQNEIHPTAVLWGEGDSMVTSDAAELELQIIDQIPVYRDGLTAARVQSQRRACRVVPWQIENYRLDDNFVITFSLPSGCYATTVLGEIFSELA